VQLHVVELHVLGVELEIVVLSITLSSSYSTSLLPLQVSLYVISQVEFMQSPSISHSAPHDMAQLKM
jgi:hypothetical protein